MNEYIKFCNLHMYVDDKQIYLSFKPKNVKLGLYKINKNLENINEFSKKIHNT